MPTTNIMEITILTLPGSFIKVLVCFLILDFTSERAKCIFFPLKFMRKKLKNSVQVTQRKKIRK